MIFVRWITTGLLAVGPLGRHLSATRRNGHRGAVRRRGKSDRAVAGYAR